MGPILFNIMPIAIIKNIGMQSKSDKIRPKWQLVKFGKYTNEEPTVSMELFRPGMGKLFEPDGRLGY